MMANVALVAGIVGLAAWSYLLVGHGRFWSVRRALPQSRPAGGGTQTQPRIAVVIPARNEADVIGRAIASLLAQQSAGGLHIFIVDDHSSDGTGEVAQAIDSSRVTVIAGRPLPPGWTGKLWAVQQGVEQALQREPDFLLLTDADVEHAPDSVATLVNMAEAGGYDLTSFMVKLHCHSFAEKLLIPAFVFFFFMLYPPEWVRDPRRRTAGAAGGCMLMRPTALERIGGIAAIRQEIIDDCALAGAVKRSGGKVWLGAASAAHSLRPYKSFAEIERMIARTAFNQLQHSSLLLAATVIGMLLLYVWPVALLASGSRLVLLGAGAGAVMFAAYLPMVRFYRLNPLWAMTLPFAGVFCTVATVHSAVKYWVGKGGEWKGRAQDVA